MQIHGLTYEEDTIKSTLQAWGLSLKTLRLPSKFLSRTKTDGALLQLDLSQSQLWILDEPFNGLDTSGTGRLINAFSRHLANNGAIVLTSHLHNSIAHSDSQLEGFLEEIIELTGVI
jgi:heme exporter protein A